MQDISQLGFSIDSSPAVQASQNLDRMVMAAQGAQAATASLTTTSAAYQRAMQDLNKEQTGLVTGLGGFGAAAQNTQKALASLADTVEQRVNASLRAMQDETRKAAETFRGVEIKRWTDEAANGFRNLYEEARRFYNLTGTPTSRSLAFSYGTERIGLSGQEATASMLGLNYAQNPGDPRGSQVRGLLSMYGIDYGADRDPSAILADWVKQMQRYRPSTEMTAATQTLFGGADPDIVNRVLGQSRSMAGENQIERDTRLRLEDNTKALIALRERLESAGRAIEQQTLELRSSRTPSAVDRGLAEVTSGIRGIGSFITTGIPANWATAARDREQGYLDAERRFSQNVDGQSNPFMRVLPAMQRFIERYNADILYNGDTFLGTLGLYDRDAVSRRLAQLPERPESLIERQARLRNLYDMGEGYGTDVFRRDYFSNERDLTRGRMRNDMRASLDRMSPEQRQVVEAQMDQFLSRTFDPDRETLAMRDETRILDSTQGFFGNARAQRQMEEQLRIARNLPPGTLLPPNLSMDVTRVINARAERYYDDMRAMISPQVGAMNAATEGLLYGNRNGVIGARLTIGEAQRLVAGATNLNSPDRARESALRTSVFDAQRRYQGALQRANEYDDSFAADQIGSVQMQGGDYNSYAQELLRTRAALQAIREERQGLIASAEVEARTNEILANSYTRIRTELTGAIEQGRTYRRANEGLLVSAGMGAFAEREAQLQGTLAVRRANLPDGPNLALSQFENEQRRGYAMSDAIEATGSVNRSNLNNEDMADLAGTNPWESDLMLSRRLTQNRFLRDFRARYGDLDAREQDARGRGDDAELGYLSTLRSRREEGLTSSLRGADLRQQAQDAEQLRRAGQAAVSTLADGFRLAAFNGAKLNDVLHLTVTRLADIAGRAALRPIERAIEGSIGSGLNWMFGGSSSGVALNPMPQTGGISENPFGFSLGGVFSEGRIVPMARGHVVSTPHVFPLAGGGVGMMGEAGEEGVLPLKRNASGQLGVIATGSSSGSSVSVTNHITVGGGGGGGDPTMQRALADEIGRAVNQKVMEALRDQSRPGGMITLQSLATR